MSEVDRRTILRGVGAAAGLAAAGCGGSDSGGMRDAGPSADASATDASAPDAGGSLECPESNLSFAELMTGIDTVVVLCMENRSFDHYLGSLLLKESWAIDGLTGDESNPDAQGLPVAVHRLDTFTPDDPPHNWDPVHSQWNGGANDGFVTVHPGASSHQVMGYHERDQIPTIYGLADYAAVCDRYFSSVLGPTWPNRYYLNCASSGGAKNNEAPQVLLPSLWDALGAAGVEGVNFFHDVAWTFGGLGKVMGLAPVEQFFERAAAGTLPPFSMIDPDFLGAGANDDHPAHDIRLGQALIGSVFAALAQSPQWQRMLFVLTYDEHGGFFDHVPPPVAPDERVEFRRLGFRVPTLVAGPTVKRGCPVSAVFDHVSIVSTVTRLFGLQDINSRVMQTRDLSPCINPDYIGNPQPAPELPVTEISMSRLRSLPELPRHVELAERVARMRPPAGLYRKAESLDIAERVLRYGERLGAVKLRR